MIWKDGHQKKEEKSKFQTLQYSIWEKNAGLKDQQL